MKYGGFDIDNNCIISYNHAKLIFGNFLNFIKLIVIQIFIKNFQKKYKK